MNSREQTDAMSAAVLWPSVSVDKCDSWAPKGQNRIAQGFNPGLVAPVRFALKGQQIRRDGNCASYQQRRASTNHILVPLSGHVLRGPLTQG